MPTKHLHIKSNFLSKQESRAAIPKGRVILTSAGCGDPDLITVKAVKYLRQADVILTDRLVSAAILETYASPNAQIIHVGKQYNRDASLQQKEINDLIIEFAQQNKLVVRLKGGDIAFFSNVLDELQALVDNEIEYEIIPGVTAASGASAYGGIPLTARGFATSVRFLTCYKKDINTDAYWQELANTKDTLVLYMSSDNLDNVVENLVQRKIDSDKLLAVIEQATTPQQNVTIFNLYAYAKLFRNQSFASPTIIIIGKVVALHEKFAWQSNNINAEDYFPKIQKNILKESLV